MTDGPAFFRAIEADPDDDTPRLVYADWLDEHAVSDADRARAELIRVQCELAREPEPVRRTELAAREQHLLSEHAPAWAAELPLKLYTPSYRRGFLDPVALPGAHFAPFAERLAALTPLFHLRLIRVRDSMRSVAACPQLALVRRLTLSGSWLRNADMTALAVSPHLGTLQHLDLSHNQIGVQGATDFAVTRAPALRALNVGANPPLKDRGLLALALADWPALEHLDATDCGLRRAGAVGLAESALARRLVTLQLSANRAVPPDGWLALARAPLERLQRLDLSTPAVTDEVLEALAANPALAGLRVLHLGAATVTDRGARALLETPHLRNLLRLRLPTGALYTDTLQRLRTAYGTGFNPS